MGAFDEYLNGGNKPSTGNAFDDYLTSSEDEGGFKAAAKQAVGATIKGAGQAAADFLPFVGQDNPVKKYGQSVIDANPTAVQNLEDIADKPWTAVKEATGNAAGSIGGMLGVRAAGQAITAAAPFAGPFAPAVAIAGQAVAWLGPAAIAALPSFGGIRDKQIINDPENLESGKAKAIAALGAATVGAIETKFGPQNWALAAMTKEGRSKLADQFVATTLKGSIAKGVAKGAAIEGAEELVQNPIEQLAAGDDPTTPASLKETAFGGAMGAIGGGVIGGGFGAVSRRSSVEEAKTAKVVETIAAAPSVDAAIAAATTAVAEPMTDVDVEGSAVGGLIEARMGDLNLAPAQDAATRESGYADMERQRAETIAAATARATMAKDRLAGQEAAAGDQARAARDAEIGDLAREQAAQNVARRLQEHDAKGLTTTTAASYRAALVRRLDELGFGAPEAPAQPIERRAPNESVDAGSILNSSAPGRAQQETPVSSGKIGVQVDPDAPVAATMPIPGTIMPKMGTVESRQSSGELANIPANQEPAPPGSKDAAPQEAAKPVAEPSQAGPTALAVRKTSSLRPDQRRPNTLYILGADWTTRERKDAHEAVEHRGDPSAAMADFKQRNPEIHPQLSIATDAQGNPWKVVSPSGKVTDINTPEGRYALGDTDAFRKDADAKIEQGRAEGDPDKVNDAADKQIAHLTTSIAYFDESVSRDKLEIDAAQKKQKAGVQIKTVDERYDTWKEYLGNKRRILDSNTEYLGKLREELAQWESKKVKDIVGGETVQGEARPAEPTKELPAQKRARIAAEKAAAKSAWQMTRDEYRAWAAANAKENGKPATEAVKASRIPTWDEQHMGVVRRAINSGKDVPANVREEFAQRQEARKGADGTTPDVRIGGQLPSEMSVEQLQIATRKAKFKDQIEAAEQELKARDRKGLTIGGKTLDQLTDAMVRATERGGRNETVRKAAGEERARREKVDAELKERIKAPGTKEQLESLADSAGWLERGGHLIRHQGSDGTVNTEKLSRTRWIPNAGWWPNRPVAEDETYYRNAVKAAVAGEKMTAKQKSVVRFLLEMVETDTAGIGVDEAPGVDQAAKAEGLAASEDTVTTVELMGRAIAVDAEAFQREVEDLADGMTDSEHRAAVVQFLKDHENANQRQDEGDAKGGEAAGQGPRIPEGDGAQAQASEPAEEVAPAQNVGAQQEVPTETGAPASPMAAAATALRAAADAIEKAVSPAAEKAPAGRKTSTQSRGELKLSQAARESIEKSADIAKSGLASLEAYLEGSPITASATDGEFTVQVSKDDKWFGLGEWILTHKDYPDHPVPSGRWMDAWEPYMKKEYGVSEEAYAKLPEERRADIEAKNQIKRYVPNQFFGDFAEFYLADRWGLWVETLKGKGAAKWTKARDESAQKHWRGVIAKEFGVPNPQQKSVSAEETEQISDFGEKIGGARKDVWQSFRDKMKDAQGVDVAAEPLSKSWPAPDYQELLDSGADPWAVAFMHSARDEIPSKPRQPWKVKRWAEQVTLLRNFAMGLADGTMPVDRAKEELAKMAETSRGMQGLASRVELYALVGHSKSLEGVKVSRGEYTFYESKQYNPPRIVWSVQKDVAATAFSNWPRELATGDTKEAALKSFKEKYASMEIAAPVAKETSFDIFSKRTENGYWIGKKIGRNPLLLEGPFTTIKEARAYKDDHRDKLIAKLEKAKEIPSERRDTNEPRVGEDMRNGQDVTPTMFGETFGFRGVEFGNWVEQGKRQTDLNDAFDALMDMAAILNVSPKALSLNGELGLAFGARGSGGVNPAKAHYEPGHVVINLTKKEGAGSIGHEWWHALDNYFSRMREKKTDYLTEGLDVSLAARDSKYVHQGAVRKEMVDAFGQVVRSIRDTAMKARSSRLDAKRSKEYWTTGREMSARAFESYLISKLQDQNASNDYLANIVDEQTWEAAEKLGWEIDGSYPYPTAGEIPKIRAGFDHFFQTVQTKDTDKGVAMFSRAGRFTTDPSGAPLLKLDDGLTLGDPQAVRFGLPGNGDVYQSKVMQGDRVLGVAILNWKAGKVSDLLYIKTWRNLRGQGIAEKVVRGILSHNEGQPIRAVYVVPKARGFWEKMGAEFVATEDGEDGILTQENYADARGNRETSKGRGPGAGEVGRETAVGESPAGRGDAGSAGGGQALAIRAAIAPILEKWGNAPEVIVVDSMQDPKVPEGVRNADAEQRSQGASGEPEGFFHQGKVYLVAEGISSPERAVTVLFHESLGHAGLRGVFGDRLNAVLDDVAKAMPGRVRAKAAEYGLDFKNLDDRRQAAEEVLAVLAQSMPRSNIVKRAIAAIRQFLRDVGFDIQLSDSDVIAQFILPARAYVERGATSGRNVSQEGQSDAAFARNIFSDAMAFAHQVDRFVRGYMGLAPLRVTSTPDIFRRLGLAEREVQISPRILRKAMEGKHGLSANEVKAVVRELHAPVAVFDSATEPGNFVVLTSLENDGRPVVIAVTPDAVHSSVTVHAISSVHPREHRQDALRWTEKGLLRYVDQTKRPGWWAGELQLLKADSTAGDASKRILTEQDFVKPADGGAFSRDQTASAAFREWFGDSKVVDADGKPLVVYHGTAQDFSVFDASKAGSNTRHPTARLGFWASESAAVADLFNEAWDMREWPHKRTHMANANTMPLYLSIKNPYVLTVEQFRDINGRPYGEEFEREQPEAAAKTKDWTEKNKTSLLAKGHDGIKIEGDPAYAERMGGEEYSAAAWVAFKPEQIKSAIGNRGTFDPKDPDIRFSRSGPIGAVLASPKVSGFLDGLFKSPASFGVLKPFQTQYHKAEMLARKGMPEFKAVFDRLNTYLTDISAIAVKAEQQAPAIFRELTGIGPKSMKAFFKGAASEKDVQAIGPWLVRGTLYGGGSPMEGVKWTKDELMGKRATNGRVLPQIQPLTEYQADLYRQARAAIDQSLEDNAKAILHRHVAKLGVDFDRDMSLADVAETIREKLNELVEDTDIKIEAATVAADEAHDAHEAAKDKFQGTKSRTDRVTQDNAKVALDNAEGLLGNLKAERELITGLVGDSKAEAARKRNAGEDPIEGIVNQVEKKAKGLIDHGYMPLSRFGNRTVTATDAEGKVKFFGTYDGTPLVPGSANREMYAAAKAIKEAHPEWTVTTGVKAEKAWKMYEGLSLEALENFMDFLDPETKAELQRDAVIQEYLSNAVNNRSVLKRLIHRQGTPGFSTDVPRVLAAFVTSNARNASGLYNLGEAKKLVGKIPKEQGDVVDEAAEMVEYVTKPNEEAAMLRGFLFFHFLGGSVAAAAVNLTQTPMVTAPYLTQHASVADVAASIASAAKMAVKDPASMLGPVGDALQKAEREGITAPQQIHHLTATAANNPFSSNRHFRTFMTMWGGMFGAAEVFNRRIAFIAAYDIANKNDIHGAAAYAFASKAVTETQFIYSRVNRPNLGRGAIGATVMTFKTFSISYLELLRRMPPKQQLMMLGILLLAAGAEGLPFEEDIADGVDTLGQWLGFATNTRKWTGKVVKDAVGEDLARPILKGLGGMLPLDLHSRLGMGNLIPATAFFKQSEIDKTRDVAEAVGPVGSVLKSFSDSLQLLARGKWDKAAVGVAPKAVRDAYNGVHMAATGESQDTKGRLALRDVTAIEGVGKAIGFNPRRAAMEGEAKREVMLDRNLRTVRMDEIASDWADGILQKDLDKAHAARDRLRDWNADNPEMRINGTQIMRSVQERVRAARKTSAERFLKSTPKAMRQDAKEALAQ